MSNLKIKQISHAGSTPDSYIAFNGFTNVWQKSRHTQEFAASDLDDGVLTVQHDLGRKYVVITLYDDEDEQVLADKIKVFNDYAEITLTSFMDNMNNWVVVVS